MSNDRPEAPELWRTRYTARRWLWEHGSVSRVRNCGRVAQGQAVSVLRYPSGAVSGTGVQHCASIWACPVCSARILAGRADQLRRVLDGFRSRWDGQIAMATFTMSHEAGTDLVELWDDVQSSWSGLVASPAWRRMQDRYGVVLDPVETIPAQLMGEGPREWPAVEVGTGQRRIPVVRVVELTHGRHGWHVHIHALLLLGPGFADAQLAELWDGWSYMRGKRRYEVKGLVQRWQAQAEKRGRTADREAQEIHLMRGDAAELVSKYLAKAVMDGQLMTGKLAAELGRPDCKQGRVKSSATVWQLLAAAVEGDKRAASLWSEYETVSKGRRQMVISGDLLRVLGETEATQSTDEELADSDADPTMTGIVTPGVADKPHSAVTEWPSPIGPPEVVCAVAAGDWSRAAASGLERLGELLQAGGDVEQWACELGLGCQLANLQDGPTSVYWVAPGVISRPGWVRVSRR